MELLYEFGKCQSIANVHFGGLDGCESVASVKEALGLMQITNPAVAFAEDVKIGKYNAVSDEDYQLMLDTIKRISSLWRYPDDPPGAQTRYQMSVLMLLANALTLASEQHTQLRLHFGQA